MRTLSEPHARRTQAVGLGLALLGGAGALGIAVVLSPVSALTVAVVAGLACGGLLPAGLRPALGGSVTRLLRIGVVLLGLQLPIHLLVDLGAATLLAVVAVVAVTFGATLGLGALLRVRPAMTLLVATGFSICGASAIAAMASVSESEEDDVATGLALVTFYGTLAMIALPLAGGWLGLTGEDIGTWAGLSVHEVGQVVAAASPAGTAAISVAVLVKLSRVVLLGPLVTTVGVVRRRRDRAATDPAVRPPLVPAFVVGFLAMIGVASLDVLPPALLDVVGVVTTLALAAALFGLGAAVRPREILRSGRRATVLGLCSTLVVVGLGLVATTVLG